MPADPQAPHRVRRSAAYRTGRANPARARHARLSRPSPYCMAMASDSVASLHAERQPIEVGQRPDLPVGIVRATAPPSGRPAGTAGSPPVRRSSPSAGGHPAWRHRTAAAWRRGARRLPACPRSAEIPPSTGSGRRTAARWRPWSRLASGSSRLTNHCTRRSRPSRSRDDLRQSQIEAAGAVAGAQRQRRIVLLHADGQRRSRSGRLRPMPTRPARQAAPQAADQRFHCGATPPVRT